MNKNVNLILASVLSATVFTGCSGMIVSPPETSTPNGIRVYPPRVLLFVGTDVSYLKFVPDYDGAYDIRPYAFLSKHDLKLSMSDGILTEAESKQDTTSIIPLLQKAAELAAGASGAGVSGEEYNSAFGLKEGVYALDKETGVFIRQE